jgi:hypothetical protein
VTCAWRSEARGSVCVEVLGQGWRVRGGLRPGVTCAWRSEARGDVCVEV